jgi:GTP-binding protein EngB required for normal cell division
MIILLIDSRRSTTEEDQAIVKWAEHNKKPVLLIFTKSDTLSERERKSNVEKTLEQLPIEHSLSYSVKDSRSRQNLITNINKLLHGHSK